MSERIPTPRGGKYGLLAVFGVVCWLGASTAALGGYLGSLAKIAGTCCIIVAAYGLYTQRTVRRLPQGAKVVLAIGVAAIAIFVVVMAGLILFFRNFT